MKQLDRSDFDKRAHRYFAFRTDDELYSAEPLSAWDLPRIPRNNSFSIALDEMARLADRASPIEIKGPIGSCTNKWARLLMEVTRDRPEPVCKEFEIPNPWDMPIIDEPRLIPNFEKEIDHWRARLRPPDKSIPGEAHLPQLCEHPWDILPIFLSCADAHLHDSRIREISYAAIWLLTNYPWPGDTEELQRTAFAVMDDFQSADATLRFEHITNRLNPDVLFRFMARQFEFEPHAWRADDSEPESRHALPMPHSKDLINFVLHPVYCSINWLSDRTCALAKESSRWETALRTALNPTTMNERPSTMRLSGAADILVTFDLNLVHKDLKDALAEEGLPKSLATVEQPTLYYSADYLRFKIVQKVRVRRNHLPPLID
jgi:hypothetical protein